MRWKSGLRRQLGRQIVVHTCDDQTLRGTLRELFRDSLVLAAPEYLATEDDGTPKVTKLPGDAGVPWSNFAWWQEV